MQTKQRRACVERLALFRSSCVRLQRSLVCLRNMWLGLVQINFFQPPLDRFKKHEATQEWKRRIKKKINGKYWRNIHNLQVLQQTFSLDRMRGASIRIEVFDP